MEFEWDSFSDQPKILPKEAKKRLRKNQFKNNLKIFWSNLKYFFPLMLKSIIFPTKGNTSNKNILGLCVNLDKGDKQAILVDEIGVDNLLIRVFLNDIDNIDKYMEFAKSFKDKKIVFNIIQDRPHIKNKILLEKDIKIVFEKLSCISDEFIIGNAINRIKWGFINVLEYITFYKSIFDIRDRYFKDIKLIGPSIIDFEFYYLIPILYNNSDIYFDKISVLLYVDRRGSPKNKQYFIFDLKKKIDFLYDIVKYSKKCSNEIYITETNYPIKNSKPYAPTSEKECVSLEEYKQYMTEYFEISKESKKIKKIFWHQLIAPGYGLVDNRYGLKKYPQFYSFKQMSNLN